MEKTISYTTKNTYATLNTITPKTKNVWFVFHGIGYLSKYFIKYFECLDSEENYIVAPQAPSKYYLKNEYKYVGASWLTKENTPTEIHNVLNYIDAVFEAEQISPDLNLILFGFSQGVSVVTRWVAQRKLNCKALILYAGGIPNELNDESFSHFDFSTAEVKIIYGETDQYLNTERLVTEKNKADILFQENAEIIMFKGGHEINPEIIRRLI